jgi:DNA recombination protein RmuC
MILAETPAHLPAIAAGAAALAVGWLLAHLLAKSRLAALAERIHAGEARAQELENRLRNAVAAEGEASQESRELGKQLAELRATLDANTKAAAEKQQLLEQAEARLSDTFKALSADALRSSNEQFLQLAKASLATQTEEAKGDLDQRRSAIENLVKPVADSLEKVQSRIGDIEKERQGAYSSLKQQVLSLLDTQEKLHRETNSLVAALRQPQTRGRWGELQLQRVVELAGMQQHCDFDLQHTMHNDDGGRQRPDLVVHLPAGRTIVVDSKAPMDAYLDAVQATDDATRDEALNRHAHQVRSHIQQLSGKKYAASLANAPEFTVLFLPGESFFSAALRADPDLIERGANQNVLLATPTTLIAMLRTVAHGWRQEALAQNAREISALGRTLYERLGKMEEHLTKLGRSLNSSVEQYNNTVGSFETRVLSCARKFEELKASPESASLPALDALDSRARDPRSMDAALPAPGIEETPGDFSLVPETDPDDADPDADRPLL